MNKLFPFLFLFFGCYVVPDPVSDFKELRPPILLVAKSKEGTVTACASFKHKKGEDCSNWATIFVYKNSDGNIMYELNTAKGKAGTTEAEVLKEAEIVLRGKPYFSGEVIAKDIKKVICNCN